MVIGIAGIGLLYVSRHMASTGGDFAEAAQVPFAVGMLSLAIGIGFILSAFVAYLLSRRLGLFEPPVTTTHA